MCQTRRNSSSTIPFAFQWSNFKGKCVEIHPTNENCETGAVEVGRLSFFVSVWIPADLISPLLNLPTPLNNMNGSSGNAEINLTFQNKLFNKCANFACCAKKASAASRSCSETLQCGLRKSLFSTKLQVFSFVVSLYMCCCVFCCSDFSVMWGFKHSKGQTQISRNTQIHCRCICDY